MFIVYFTHEHRGYGPLVSEQVSVWVFVLCKQDFSQTGNAFNVPFCSSHSLLQSTRLPTVNTIKIPSDIDGKEMSAYLMKK